MTKRLVTILVLICMSTLASAQFGQNKVQYQKFRWKYISSEHFDVYYHDGLQYIAEFCAVKAETALHSISNNFNFRISKRLNLMVYGSHNEFQQTNVLTEFLPEGVGGVTELYKNRIVLPFEGDWERFRHVIHHELVHAFLNEMFYNGSIKYAIQSRIQMPLWMNEGLAEYESLNGLDNATDMFMRDITLSESLPRLDQLANYFAYRGGQAFYAYVADRYGREKISELLSRIRSGLDIQMVFKLAFGMDLADFSEQWQNDVKKQYYPDLDKYKRLEEFSKRLTNHVKEDNYYNSSPSLSPDGNTVAFISYRDGDYAIYVMNIEKKSEAVKLVSSQRSLNFEELNVLTPGISWNPTGDKIAITAKAGGEDALFIVDAVGGDYKKYSFDIKSMTSASWSPDGKNIAVVATVLEQPDLYLFNVVNKSFVKLTNDIFTDAHPVWSSDSKSIYFISDRGDMVAGNVRKDSYKMWQHDITQSDIYKVSLATREIERVTKDPSHLKTSVCISRDEKKLLFVAENNGIGNLYEMNLESKSIRPKTNSLSGITQIALSRDETKLLFAAQNRGSMDLFMIRGPLDKNLQVDSLPLTKLRVRVQEQQSFVKDIKPDKDLTLGSKQHFVGYGNFDIDVKRQTGTSANLDLPDNSSFVSEEQKSDKEQSFTPTDYKVTITNDLVYGGVGYNSLWNNGQSTIEMLFSDLLGDHVIYTTMQLWSDLKNSNITLQYQYLPDVVDYFVSAHHFSFLSVLQNPRRSRSLAWYSLRNYGVDINAQYAFSKFQRLEAGVSWIAVNKANESDPTDESSNESRNFIVPEFRFVSDNTQFGLFAPYKGTRMFVDLKVSPLTTQFATLTADIRHYLPLWKEYYGFMFRFSGGSSFGPNPRRFFLGGVDNWIARGDFGFGYNLFSEPEDFAFLQLQTPVRGFELGQTAGKNFALGNIEFRFPFFSGFVAVPIPFVLLGAVFVDIGSSWNGGLNSIALRNPIDTNDFNTGRRVYYSPGSVLLSSGLGLRTVLLGYPVKLDIAWRREGERWSEPNYVFSLGIDL